MEKINTNIIIQQKYNNIMKRILAKNDEGRYIVKINKDLQHSYKLGVDVFDAIIYLAFKENVETGLSSDEKLLKNLQECEDNKNLLSKIEEQIKRIKKKKIFLIDINEKINIVQYLILNEFTSNYYLRANINEIIDRETNVPVLHLLYELGQFDLLENFLFSFSGYLDSNKSAKTYDVDRLNENVILPAIDVDVRDRKSCTIVEKIDKESLKIKKQIKWIDKTIEDLRSSKDPSKFVLIEKKIQELNKSKKEQSAKLKRLDVLKSNILFHRDQYKDQSKKLISNEKYYAKTAKRDLESGEIYPVLGKIVNIRNPKNFEITSYKEQSADDLSKLLKRLKSDLKKILFDKNQYTMQLNFERQMKNIDYADTLSVIITGMCESEEALRKKIDTLESNIDKIKGIEKNEKSKVFLRRTAKIVQQPKTTYSTAEQTLMNKLGVSFDEKGKVIVPRDCNILDRKHSIVSNESGYSFDTEEKKELFTNDSVGMTGKLSIDRVKPLNVNGSKYGLDSY